MESEVWSALAAGGPMGIVLGIAVWKLWTWGNGLAQQITEGASAFAVKLDAIRSEQQQREDALRTHYQDRFDTERAENKADLRALTEVLQGYTEEE